MNRETWCSLLMVLAVGFVQACGGDDDDGGPDDEDVTAAPVISSFTASSTSLAFGATSTLSWTVDNGTLSINGESVTGTSLDVTPTASTTYTLTATNRIGATTAQVAVAVSSVPAEPLTYGVDDVFTISTTTTHWVRVPAGYDATHQTPYRLFVWSHGCGGDSSGGIYNVSPGGAAQTWITLAPGGREGGCWNMSEDPAAVRAAITELRTHFNIDPKRIVLGGYSSGGDLSYRMAYEQSLDYAGVLAADTSPFRDTGVSQAQGLASATWKFNVYHLAHLSDDVYPIAGVRSEVQALVDAGFPATLVERPGSHYDPPGGLPGTDADIQTYLLPRLDEGWVVP